MRDCAPEIAYEKMPLQGKTMDKFTQVYLGIKFRTYKVNGNRSTVKKKLPLSDPQPVFLLVFAFGSLPWGLLLWDTPPVLAHVLGDFWKICFPGFGMSSRYQLVPGVPSNFSTHRSNTRLQGRQA
jgi:hypothetical protein